MLHEHLWTPRLQHGPDTAPARSCPTRGQAQLQRLREAGTEHAAKIDALQAEVDQKKKKVSFFSKLGSLSRTLSIFLSLSLAFLSLSLSLSFSLSLFLSLCLSLSPPLSLARSLSVFLCLRAARFTSLPAFPCDKFYISRT